MLTDLPDKSCKLLQIFNLLKNKTKTLVSAEHKVKCNKISYTCILFISWQDSVCVGMHTCAVVYLVLYKIHPTVAMNISHSIHLCNSGFPSVTKKHDYQH